MCTIHLPPMALTIIAKQELAVFIRMNFVIIESTVSGGNDMGTQSLGSGLLFMY